MPLWQAVNFAVSLVVLTALFAMLFKWFPDVPVRWRDVWPGALASAVLFEAGKLAIAWYIAHQGLQSTYGAAASLVVLLIWVYYTAQIVLFGAEISHAYAQRTPRGSRGNVRARSEPAAGTLVARRRETRADDFETFWWYYLREHGKPETRALHIAGTALALLCAAGALRSLAMRPRDRYVDPPTWLAAALLMGYAPAWISHLAYEGNRPATFQHPVRSLLADLKMAWLWATGGLDKQLGMGPDQCLTAARGRCPQAVTEKVRRPGSGTIRWSAEAAARSSTRGGRQRRGDYDSPTPGGNSAEARIGDAAVFRSVQPALVDEKGAILEGAAHCNLVVSDSWPGHARLSSTMRASDRPISPLIPGILPTQRRNCTRANSLGVSPALRVT